MEKKQKIILFSVSVLINANYNLSILFLRGYIFAFPTFHSQFETTISWMENNFTKREAEGLMTYYFYLLIMIIVIKQSWTDIRFRIESQHLLQNW